MANRINNSQSANNGNRNLPRPDSIPGMEDLTAAAPARTSATKSRSGATSPTVLSPDGAELAEHVSTAEVTKEVEPTEVFECAICLQICVHPVKLPCSHIFCFLCIKGVAIQSKRCALCRQDIPVEFCNDPALLRREDLLKEFMFEDGYQWYYQGMNGWWQYDERASRDIEDHYKTGEKTLEMLIAGFLYIVDFENMLQYRRNDPTRRRKIKRDLITIPDKKGVAGLKITSPSTVSPHRLDGDGGENVPCVVQQGAVPATTPTNAINHGNRVAQRSPRRSPAVSPSTPHSTPEDDVTFTNNHGNTNLAPHADSQDMTYNMAALSLTANPSTTSQRSVTVPADATATSQRPLPHRKTRSRTARVQSPQQSQSSDEEQDRQ